MARTDELRASLRDRRANAEQAFQRFKFGELAKDVPSVSLAFAETEEIGIPAIPALMGRKPIR